MAVDVAAIIDAAETRAETMTNEAMTALDAIGSRIIAVGLPGVSAMNLPELNMPNIPGAPNINPASAMPTLTAPTKPDVQGIVDNFASLTAPDAPTSSRPDVQEPRRPSDFRDFTKTAPPLSLNVTLPTAPDTFNTDSPSLGEYVIPDKPVIARQEFRGVRESFTGIAPPIETKAMQAFETASSMMYDAVQTRTDAYLRSINPQFATALSTMEAKIAAYTSGGNTGLLPEIENAIYERSKSKTDAETQRVQAEALRTAARRGFTLPDGALMSALQQARQAGADNNAKAAVEIAVMQAEMNQKNIQFALTLSADVRKTMVNAALSYHQNLISLNGAALQYSQNIVNALMQKFNAEVQVFQVKLEQYKADADVFRTLTEASMNEVKIYEAEINALQAMVSVDSAKVQMYRSQIEAHQAAVVTYSKNVEAIVQVASLERLKLDLFQAEVQAYSAEVQAKGSEWQAYSAAWAGEEAKVKAFLSEAQVYSAQVEGYRARVQAESSRIQALATSNQAELGSYTAQVQAYGEEARANAAVIAAEISTQGALINAYQVESQAAIAQASAEAERFKALGQVRIAEAQLNMQSAIEQSRLNVTLSQNNAQIALSAGQVYAGMASAALSGVNTLASAVLEGQ